MKDFQHYCLVCRTPIDDKQQRLQAGLCDDHWQAAVSNNIPVN